MRHSIYGRGLVPYYEHNSDKGNNIGTFQSPMNIPVNGYNYLFNSDCLISQVDENGVFTLRESSRDLMKQKIDFEKLREINRSGRDLPTDAFILKNDSLLVIIESITLKETDADCHVKISNVFSKKPLIISDQK